MEGHVLFQRRPDRPVVVVDTVFTQPITDRVLIADWILRYGALGLAQFLVAAALLTCQRINERIGDDADESGILVYLVSGLLLYQGAMHILVFIKGRKLNSDLSANDESSVRESIGQCVISAVNLWFGQAILTIIGIMSNWTYLYRAESTNKKLTLVANFILYIFALFSPFATVTMLNRQSRQNN